MIRIPDDAALAIEVAALREFDQQKEKLATLPDIYLLEKRSEILAWLSSYNPRSLEHTLKDDKAAKPFLQRLVELSVIQRILSEQGPALR